MKKQKNQSITMHKLKNMLWDLTDGKDWEDKYYPDNLAKSIVISSNDLLKEFQWVDNVDSWEKINNEKGKQKIAYEMIHVISYTMMLAEIMKIDIVTYLQMRLREKYSLV